MTGSNGTNGTGTNGTGTNGTGTNGTGNGHAGGNWGSATNPNLGGNSGNSQAQSEFDGDDIGFHRATVQYQGRSYTREVDGRWVDSTGAELTRTPLGYIINPPPPAAPLWQDVRLADWARRTIPDRAWIMEDWIPRQQCVGLYGISGIYKSTFLLQLLMAASLGLPFCGLPIARVPVYGLFCEDTEEEIVRRARRIADFYRRDLADFTDFHFASLVGQEETELVSFDFGKMTKELACQLFEDRLTEHRAGLAVLDTLPDFFGGEEVRRRETSRFFRVLDGISMKHDCAIIGSAHPSQYGRRSGRLDSGNSGIEGKMRARLVLHDPGDDDLEEIEGETTEQKQHRITLNPTERRILTRVNSNYAKVGETIELIIRDGAFHPAAIDPGEAKLRGPMRNMAAETRFLELMAKVKAAGIWVHDMPSVPARYAPTVFARHSDHGDFTEKEFEKAMNRMMGTRIRLVKGGSGRHTHMEFEAI